MPEVYKEYGRKWQELNPGILIMNWNRDILDSFPDLYDVFQDLRDRDGGRNGVELAVQTADVIAYALVARHGGMYVNCDMEPVRRLPAMPNIAWASLEDDYFLNNAAFGAPRESDPFWVGLIEALPANYFAKRTQEMVFSTGPQFLTEYAYAHPGYIAILPQSVFNSTHWRDVPLGGDASGRAYPDDAIAVHHWGHKKDGRTNHVETATQA